MTYTFSQLLWMFFIYAFIGWCAEVIFHTVRYGDFVNRGFLNGPVCPIYGFGVVAIILLLTPLQEHLLLLFLGAMLVTSALEFVTGWCLEKIFHAKWWDYSRNKFNLKGYICLEFSLLWGLAATFIMKVLHPVIYALVSHIPHTLSIVLLSFFSLAMAADLIATVATIHGLQKKVRLLAAMSQDIHEFSDGLGDNIYKNVSSAKEKADDFLSPYIQLNALSEANRAQERALAKQHRAEELQLFEQIRSSERSKREQAASAGGKERKALPVGKLLAHKGANSRLLHAFPDLTSHAQLNMLCFLLSKYPKTEKKDEP